MRHCAAHARAGTARGAARAPCAAGKMPRTAHELGAARIGGFFTAGEGPAMLSATEWDG
jgi:hypothetical protein